MLSEISVSPLLVLNCKIILVSMLLPPPATHYEATSTQSGAIALPRPTVVTFLLT